MHPPWRTATFQWLSQFSGSQVTAGILLAAVTTRMLGLSPKHPVWFQWAAVAISGYLSPLLGSLFCTGQAVQVPRSRTGPAHSCCFYTTPSDRRKISNCFHTRPNSKDLCPSKLQVNMTRAANSMFYCRELLCVHLLAVSAG